MTKPVAAPPIRCPDPWDPQAVADDILSRDGAVDHGEMISAAEVPVVQGLVKRYGFDMVNGVWIDGHHGPQALLWPMRLGHGDNA